MKGIFALTLLALAMSVSVFAQSASLKAVLDKYSGKEGIVSVSLKNPASLLGQESDGEAMDALKNVSNLKILSLEEDTKSSPSLAKEFAKDVLSINATQDGYEEFMSVHASGSNVNMYIKKNGESIVEFLMTVVEKDEQVVLIWANGKIDPSKISEIGNSMGNLKKAIKGGKKGGDKSKSKKDKE